jgi:hypothetical protein
MRLALMCLILCLPMRTAVAQSSVDSVLHAVEALYTSGSYAQAELEARRLIESELLSDSLHTVGEQWVAFALVAQGKPALAREHFASILRRQPSYELDPITTSPKILVVFSEARAAFRSAQLKQADTSIAQKGVTPGRATFRTLLFPGWEQLYQGRTTVGMVFLGAGVATLGAGIALEFLRRSARSDYLSATNPADIDAKYDTYNRYHQAEIYAFVGFAIVYLASEIEVFTYDSAVTLSAGPINPDLASSGFTLSFRLP